MKNRFYLFYSLFFIMLFCSFFMVEILAAEEEFVLVTNESELNAAMKTGGYVRLSNDIEIASILAVSTDTTLDLNGYMIHQTGNLAVINGKNLNSSTLTIMDSRPLENSHYFIKHEDAAWEYSNTEVEGAEVITGGIITGGNNVTDVSSRGGGAIQLNDKSDNVIINGGTIVGNYAVRAGGASYGGAVTMNGGRICGNAGGKFAGAIALSGNFTMNGGTIEENYSPPGTNQYKFNITDISIGENSNFTVTGGVIKANIATVLSSSKTTLSVSNDAQIVGNIYLQNGIKANITGGKIEGRIRMTKGSFAMSGGEITGGVADDSEINYFGLNGGGVSVEGGNFTMTGGQIHNNIASSNGGGVYVNGGTFIMNGGSIFGNEAPSGGGVFVNSGNATITSGSIGMKPLEDDETRANIASLNGGGIYVAGGNVTIDGGNINYNEANLDGGGLYLTGGEFLMTSGSINNNLAVNGGGAYVNSATFELTGGEFNNNVASSNGGGFYVGDDSVVNLSDGEVGYNKAKNGGGFYQSQDSNLSTTKLTGNCDVHDNEAFNGNGGGVYIAGGSVFRAVGGRVAYNKASNSSLLNDFGAKDSSSGVGGGVYILKGTFTMYDEDDTSGNAAIFGNVADYAADDLFATGEDTSFDAISVVSMEKDDKYKTSDSWFEDYPVGEEHITLNYNYRNDEDDANDMVVSVGRYKDIENVDDMEVATTVLHRNCEDYIAITMGSSVGNIKISVVDKKVISAHSFIYKIESCSNEDCSDENPELEMEVVAFKGKAAEVFELPSGLYRVTFIPSWSWRYGEEVKYNVIENAVEKDKVVGAYVDINVLSEQFTEIKTSYDMQNKLWLSKSFIEKYKQ